MFELIHSNPDLWKFLCIPLVFSLTLAFCNWLFIGLTFYPTQFIGLFKRIGWKGLAHSRVEKVGKIFADKIILQLSSMHQMVEVLEPETLVNQIERVIRPHLDEYVDEVMVKEKRIVWENLPFFIKNRIYARSHRQLRRVVDDLIDGMGNDIIHLFDLNHLITEKFKADPNLLNQFFLKTGQGAYHFLIQGAMVIALIFGTIPAVLMYFTGEKWVLPGLGAIIGLVTNVFIVRMIYGPEEEIKIGPLRWTGILYRYRDQFTQTFSELLSTQVLTIGNIIDNIFNGPKRKRSRQLVRKHIHPIVDSTVVKTLTQITMGPRGFVDLKNVVTDKVMEISSFPFEDRDFESDRARVVKAHFQHQLESKSNKALSQLVRPVIQQDEVWLYIGGGLFEGIVGFFLYVILFQLL